MAGSLIPELPTLPAFYELVLIECHRPGRELRIVPAPLGNATLAIVWASILWRETPGTTLKAVAWWIDRPFDECEPGEERLAARFKDDRWSDWIPEEALGPPPALGALVGHSRGKRAAQHRQSGGR